MGYETKLVIGQVGTKMANIEDAAYFIKMATIDLCKCGEGKLRELHDKAQRSKDEIAYPPVHWSNSFKIRQDKVLETLKKDKDGEMFLEAMGDNLEFAVKRISRTAEGWENDVYEDSYGDVLKAIPVMEVYTALKIDAAQHVINEGGKTYRRFDAALALLKTLIGTFSHYDVDEKKTVCRLTCVLYGY